MARISIAVLSVVTALLNPAFVSAGAPASNRATVFAVANANGAFRVNGVTANGSSRLAVGATVETERVAATVHAQSGGQWVLAPGARVRLNAGSARLERGTARLHGAAIESGGLLVQGGTADVRLTEGGKVVVASVQGETRVVRRQVLLARVPAGQSVEVQPATGVSPDAYVVRGYVQPVPGRAGAWRVTDEASGVTVEATEDWLGDWEGQKVVLEGLKTGSSGDIVLLKGTGLTPIAPPPPPAVTASAPAIGPVAHTGLGAGKAIILGMEVAGGAVGGNMLGRVINREARTSTISQ
ncbi:MAG: hypothetical protein FJW40_22320 [Acidobacteria bacterium]|nr:hypothetical protein [Acidobacteriota bacterium]